MRLPLQVYNVRDVYMYRLTSFVLQHWSAGKLLQQLPFIDAQPLYYIPISAPASSSSSSSSSAGGPGRRRARCCTASPASRPALPLCGHTALRKAAAACARSCPGTEVLWLHARRRRRLWG
jgi:hypothetical protein